jgi:hypothetical protein
MRSRVQLLARLVPLLVLLAMLALPMLALGQPGNDATDVFGALVSSAFSLVCCIGWFVLNIAILIWVYRDANRYGANGLLWALIVFFAGIVGLLLYFALGRNSGSRR